MHRTHLLAHLLPVPLLLVGAILAGCTDAQNAKVSAAITRASADAQVAGQLFCGIATKNGPLIVAVIDATATAAAGSAAPVVIMATNATAAFVRSVCDAAGGIPVSPPPAGQVVPNVAVVPPVGAP